MTHIYQMPTPIVFPAPFQGMTQPYSPPSPSMVEYVHRQITATSFCTLIRGCPSIIHHVGINQFAIQKFKDQDT